MDEEILENAELMSEDHYISAYVYVYYDNNNNPQPSPNDGSNIWETRRLYKSAPYTPSQHLPSITDSGYVLSSINVHYITSNQTFTVYPGNNQSFTCPDENITIDYFYVSNYSDLNLSITKSGHTAKAAVSNIPANTHALFIDCYRQGHYNERVTHEISDNPDTSQNPSGYSYENRLPLNEESHLFYNIESDYIYVISVACLDINRQTICSTQEEFSIHDATYGLTAVLGGNLLNSKAVDVEASYTIIPGGQSISSDYYTLHIKIDTTADENGYVSANKSYDFRATYTSNYEVRWENLRLSGLEAETTYYWNAYVGNSSRPPASMWAQGSFRTPLTQRALQAEIGGRYLTAHTADIYAVLTDESGDAINEDFAALYCVYYESENIDPLNTQRTVGPFVGVVDSQAGTITWENFELSHLELGTKYGWEVWCTNGSKRYSDHGEFITLDVEAFTFQIGPGNEYDLSVTETTAQFYGKIDPEYAQDHNITSANYPVHIRYGTTAGLVEGTYRDVEFPSTTTWGCVYSGELTGLSPHRTYYWHAWCGPVDASPLIANGVFETLGDNTQKAYVFDGNQWMRATAYVFNGEAWVVAESYLYTLNGWI